MDDLELKRKFDWITARLAAMSNDIACLERDSHPPVNIAAELHKFTFVPAKPHWLCQLLGHKFYRKEMVLDRDPNRRGMIYHMTPYCMRCTAHNPSYHHNDRK